MIPSLTSGEASKEYLAAAPETFRRVIQATLSCLTLEVLALSQDTAFCRILVDNST